MSQKVQDVTNILDIDSMRQNVTVNKYKVIKNIQIYFLPKTGGAFIQESVLIQINTVSGIVCEEETYSGLFLSKILLLSF